MTDGAQSDLFRITDLRSYVKIRYSVRIADGPLLKGAGEPAMMDFVTGYMQVVPGLEKRLIGHCQGEKLSFTVPPEEAFGERHPELLIEKSREDFHFPPGFEPFPGMELPLVSGNDNAPETVIIRQVTENTIVIDLNPPLAGAALHYNLEIVEARGAQPTEVCSEWDAQSVEHTRCPSVPEIVLGPVDETEH